MSSPYSMASSELDDDDDKNSSLHYVDSEPLSTEALNYEYCNGRRYHGFHPGRWPVPNDEKEQERMELLHTIWKTLANGRLTRTALIHPKRVLDVGTGTGSWAVDMADEFAKADIIGTDLSPIQNPEAPPNCHFFVDDYEENWDWEESFDFIHGRCLGGSISRWRAFYRQCFRNLVPGGKLEIQEHDFAVTSQMKDVPKWVSHWQHELNGVFRSKLKRELQLPVELHTQYLKDVGFSDVKVESVNVPIGPWAKDERLKKLGERNQQQFLDLVESYSLLVYTEFLKKTLEETQVTIAMTKNELRDKKHNLMIKFHFITATRPLCK